MILEYNKLPLTLGWKLTVELSYQLNKQINISCNLKNYKKNYPKNNKAMPCSNTNQYMGLHPIKNESLCKYLWYRNQYTTIIKCIITYRHIACNILTSGLPMNCNEDPNKNTSLTQTISSYLKETDQSQGTKTYPQQVIE